MQTFIITYRPNLESTLKSKKSKKSKTTKKKVASKSPKQQQQQQEQYQEEDTRVEETRYVGCFASESSFQGTDDDIIYDENWSQTLPFYSCTTIWPISFSSYVTYFLLISIFCSSLLHSHGIFSFSCLFISSFLYISFLFSLSLLLVFFISSIHSDRIYDGGSTGANHGLALYHAKSSGEMERNIMREKIFTYLGALYRV